MMRWPPWLSTTKYGVKVIIQKLKGLNLAELETNVGDGEAGKRRLVVEVKWKGVKGISLRGLKRSSVKRNFTEEGGFCGDGGIQWNEEFTSVCNLSGYKEGVFLPWEITFTVFDCLAQQQPGNKLLSVGTATLNLAEYASSAMEKEMGVEVLLTVPNTADEDRPLLCLCLGLTELKTVQESAHTTQIMPETVSRSPSPIRSPLNELSGLKAGLRRIQMFRVAKRTPHEGEGIGGRCCVMKNAGHNCSFGADSVDDIEAETDGRDGDPDRRLAINYETLAYANFSGESLYLNRIFDAQEEAWIYYNNSDRDAGFLAESTNEQASEQSLKHWILPWTKRKLGFRSTKPKVKGEPLLKKDCQEEGGDDIDYDRRLLSSSDESSYGWNKSEEGSTTSRSSFSEFGDDGFAVGSWELKEVSSRDGHLKLQAKVFFASIDQRSERAAGESACTVLVAVIANWLQSNCSEMPIKSEYDSLIRDGSLEWRKLCENEEYMQRFPDKHFDLETVIQAGVRPLSMVPEKSFIGFFRPEGLDGEDFDFLNGAMSFDNIWEEINSYESESEWVYIVSWNDHFFILKVEQDAYYIIDTLGERLYEGCNQAYILKFDQDTMIKEIQDMKLSTEKPVKKKVASGDASQTAESNEAENAQTKEEIVCSGKESCKEYVKRFLAAIPLRELQADIKKGLRASAPLHHRLQIEFHYTKMVLPTIEHTPSPATLQELDQLREPSVQVVTI